jgi:uncharacterized protein YyaL (SSP411 family)
MNRLANETSPYLLQHADNPVDWYPWGEEAFARAREQDRPILLSIGYSACHWCHVMEHESFEDVQIAALMNDRFVNVKVDREERPDVDAIYMDVVLSLTGHGGWPMTVFLTPDARPFWGGTYFPPAPRMGMPSFPDVLTAMSDAYVSRRDDVSKQAEQLVDALRRGAESRPSHELLTASLLADAVRTLSQQFDTVHGGFGGAPKFPPTQSIELLLRRGGSLELEMATKTLDVMAAGGIYDQLGGGFHRYAVDTIWLVPHFEKMLYDNALLASAYLHGWAVTGKGRYREVVEETLDYLLREMLLPEGGIASAQDADTEGHEGTTYVWTIAEVRDVLDTDEAEVVVERFGLTVQGNFEGSNILFAAAEATDRERLDRARRKLLEARSGRPQPGQDDKAIASWNGLALAALAEAGLRLERRDYLEAARSLAEFLLGPMSTAEGRLHRSFRAGQAKGTGYLEDYANVANGLVELYTATGELRYLEEAQRLAQLAIELFADVENGGFFFTPADGEALLVRRKELLDQPTPSGNSMLAYVLLRLSRLYGDAELERRAVEVFRLGHRFMTNAPGAVGHMLCALDLHFAPPREIAFVGAWDDPAASALRRAAFSRFDPNAVYAFSRGDGDPASARVPLLAGKALVDGRPAAYVCQSFACLAPISGEQELASALATEPVRMLDGPARA